MVPHFWRGQKRSLLLSRKRKKEERKKEKNRAGKETAILLPWESLHCNCAS
jgi:hypothetical protein